MTRPYGALAGVQGQAEGRASLEKSFFPPPFARRPVLQHKEVVEKSITRAKVAPLPFAPDCHHCDVVELRHLTNVRPDYGREAL